MKSNINLSEVLTPPNVRVRRFMVAVENMGWREAVYAAGPDTCSDWCVWDVGDQYEFPAVGETELILVGFDRSNGWSAGQEALGWARNQNLVPANPYHIFALSKNNKDLAEVLCLPEISAGVVTMKTCSVGDDLRLPGIFLNISHGRTCALEYDEPFDYRIWFAFVLGSRD